MSVISNRESTDYIPFGGTASSMSSSRRYSAVQTRAARRKAADRMKQLGELRLKQLKAECKLKIIELQLEIMERTTHFEECDDKETDSHHQMSVPLLYQDEGSSLDTVPYKTSAYVNLDATYAEKRRQQSSTEGHNYAVSVSYTVSTLALRKSCSDTVESQQMPSGRSPDGVANRELAASNLLVSSNSMKSGAKVPQQMLSGRIPDGVTNREMERSNLLVSSNSTQPGTEVLQQTLSGRSPDGVINREMETSNLLVSSNSTQHGTEVPQQMLPGRSPDGVTNGEMETSNLLVSSNSTQPGTEVPQQTLSGRSPDGVINREMETSNLLVCSNSMKSGAKVPQQMLSGRIPDGVTNREMETSNLLVSSNSTPPGTEVPQQMPSSRSPDGVTYRKMETSNQLVSSNSMKCGAEIPQQIPSGRSSDGVTNRETAASSLLVSSDPIRTGRKVPPQMASGRPLDCVTNKEMARSNLSASHKSIRPDADVVQQMPSSGCLGGDVNTEVCAHNHMALCSNNTVIPHSDVGWYPPRPSQPSVLPLAGQPAGANVHAPTWIPNQPGYISTPSAVFQSNTHPLVSDPYNDMTSNKRKFQCRISHLPHVTDLSPTDPELSNRDVRNTKLDRDQNELCNSVVQ